MTLVTKAPPQKSTEKKSFFKSPFFVLLVILLVGTVMRLYNLTAISLWHDEAFSALLIRYPWHEMFVRIGLDVHPPFYYITLRLWSYIFGNSLLALRGFSAFFGVATIWATYLFIKAAFKSQKLALLAAFFIAINPFQIQYVTEARMYTLGAFLVMISAYFAVRALEAQKKYFEYKKEFKETAQLGGHVWGWWLLFTLTTSAMMYTHYYLFFSVIGIFFFILYYLIKNYGKQWSAYRYAFLSYVLLLILYIPWLPTFFFQFNQVQDNYWIPKITKWSVPITNWTMLVGVGGDASKHLTDIFLLLGIVFSLFMLWRVWRKTQSAYKNFIFFALIVPFIGALALSIKQSIYLDRYFLFAALFYTLALVLFISELTWNKLRIALYLILAVVSIGSYVKSWNDLHIKSNPGMSAAADFLNANVGPNDKLYVATSFEFFNYRYYNHTPVKALFYAPGVNKVSDLPHFSGTALLNNDDLIQNLDTASKTGDTGWIIWTNAFGSSKPAVPSDWHQVYENGWSDVRPYTGTVIYVTEYKVY